MNDACANTRRLLSEQLDGTLTTDERAALRAHIATCPNCRAFERDLQAGLAGIARLPRVSGNSAIREAVLAGVHPGGRSAWPRGWRDWSGQLTKLGGAIAAFALVAVILMTVFNGTGEPDDHQSGAIPERPPFNIETATPEPIPTVPTNADIYAPPICHPDQVEYELQVDAFPGDPAINSPSFVRIGVHAIKSTGGMICRVEAPVTLTIADEAGEPLDIQGNPVTGIIAATLGPGDARTEFAWLNWCGAQDPFSLTAEILTSSDSETTTGQSTEVRPLCDDPNQPSILGQSSMAEATSAADSCQSGQVATEANDAGLQIWIIAGNPDACGGDSSVSVRLSDGAGMALPTSASEFELTLRPSESSDYWWAGALWTNWCGTADSISVTAAHANAAFGGAINSAPACVDERQPSRITVSENAPPDDILTGVGFGVSELPVCDPTTLQLLLLPISSPALYIEIEGSAAGGSEAPLCTVDAVEFTVTITGANGQLLPVDRNGETLANDPRGSTGFVWDNWCGEASSFTITVTIADQTLTLEVANGPECTDDDESSSLWGPTDSRTRGS